MKKLFTIVYYLFLAAIGLIAVLLLISVFPITGNFKFMTVLSGSMEPAIKTGSIVMVKPVSDYKVGDVITFGPNTKAKPPTTHRIIEVKNENGIISYITKGDANNATDMREVRRNEIIGRVIFAVPYAGYAVATARKPYGFFLIIVVPALLIIIDEVKNIWLEIKKAKTKKEENIKLDNEKSENQN